MNVFTLRLKLLLKDKTAVICSLVSLIILVVFLSGLEFYSEEKSSLPIGLIVLDEGAPAANLRAELIENEALYVYEDEYDALYDMLLGGYLNCILIVGRDYSDRVQRGLTDELVSIVSAKDNKVSSIVADITAGCMMYEICIDKTYLRYELLKGAVDSLNLTYDEYLAYVDEMLRVDDAYSFSFDISYIDGVTGIKNQNDITNGMLYRQMIAGMLAMMLMLIVFCTSNIFPREAESGISTRLSTMSFGKFGFAFQNVSAIFVYCLPAAFVSSCLLFRKLELSGFIRLILLNVTFLIFNCILFYLLTKIVKRVLLYQLSGTFVIVCLGVMGFLSVFEGLMGIQIFKYTPIAYYIDMFIKIGG